MAKSLYRASTVFNETMTLINLLKDKRSNVTIEGLDSLETLLNKPPSSQNNWTLSTELQFKNINKVDLKIPSRIKSEMADVLLELRINITERSYFESSIEDSIQQNTEAQPSIKYGVQIITHGKTTTTSTFPNYKMSWHLDKHIRTELGADGRGKGFVHPEYHFNMGGFALTKVEDFDYGHVLLIDTPRIQHPPLDIVLAIDFVLKNFYGIRVKNLIESRQYNKIIESAKKRLWRPYFISLAHHWESTTFNHLTIESDYANRIFGNK